MSAREETNLYNVNTAIADLLDSRFIEYRFIA